MNERENALACLRHEKYEWTPIAFDYNVFVGLWGGNECGLRGEEVREGITLDCFGCEWDQKHRSPMPYPGNYKLKDISEWRDVVKFPDISSWDWDTIAKTELKDIDRENKVIDYFSEQGMFDRLTTLMGFEEALIAMFEDPDECYEFFGAVADYKIELIDIVKEVYNPDVFMYTDDIAKADGMMFNPDFYRKYMKPHHQRIINAIKDHGMIAEQHTCGKCEKVIDDYVEVGIDAWGPGQPSNNIVSILNRHGDKIVVEGGFDSQGPAGQNGASTETTVAEANRMAEKYATLGSFIASPIIGLSTDGHPTDDELRRIGIFCEAFRKRCSELGV